MSPPSMADDLSRGMGDRRRLYILQYLAACPLYRAESTAILAHLSERHLLAISAAKLAADLVRLSEMGLVIAMPEGLGAKLTAEGLEAAEGTAVYPGVARPLPE